MRTVIVLAALALFGMPEDLHTQTRSIEIGADGGYEVLRSGGVTTANMYIPFRYLRIGADVNNRWMLETRFSADYLDHQETSETNFSAALFGLYHINDDNGKPQPYVGIGGGVSDYLSVRAAVGIKHTLTGSFGVRFETQYGRFFDTGDGPNMARLRASIGFTAILAR